MLVEWEIDYFKYDNCYPRLVGISIPSHVISHPYPGRHH